MFIIVWCRLLFWMYVFQACLWLDCVTIELLLMESHGHPTLPVIFALQVVCLFVCCFYEFTII